MKYAFEQNSEIERKEYNSFCKSLKNTLLDLCNKNILHCIFKRKTNFRYFSRYKRPEWSDFAINPFYTMKHCRALKCTVEIETYCAYDTLLSYSTEDQSGKRDIFALLPCIYGSLRYVFHRRGSWKVGK